MKKDQAWWNDEAYWHDASPFNLGNENMHWDVEKIVTEATRRGIEQGKREAWEEAESLVANSLSEEREHIQKLGDRCSCLPTEPLVDLAKEINVELASLIDSSKE